MALPKKHRLVLDRRILSTFGKIGKRIQTPLFSALSLPGKGETGRCAVVVGTSIAKKAVVRNRLRRVIQEAVFEGIRMQKTNVDMIVYPKIAIINTDRRDIKKEVKELLAKTA